MGKVNELCFHHLEDGPNIAKGSSSLRILGEKMSSVDFLVREAIQNSSDACFRERKDNKTFVCVNFDTGTFQAKRFSALFNKEIRTVLDSRYKSPACDWISISDYNCEGLNGDVHPTDPTFRSNFCRLICDSGEAQDKEGSGGCWGYGKSVYYRIGIGIVIFYSRYITEKGSYASRLIIKLAEDEKSKASLLRSAGYDKSAGIAWWCKEVKDNGWVYPIEDDETITHILDIFGIKKYEDDGVDHGDAEKTGTKIIIPYFNSAEVCKGLIPKISDEHAGLSSDQLGQVEGLVSDIHTALRFSTLRWYSSRLGNVWLKQYNRLESNAKARIPLLKVKVQGEPVNVDDAATPDFFRAVQELYNAAIYQAALAYWPGKKIDSPQTMVLKSVGLSECKIRNYLDRQRAGWVVHSVFKPANPAAPNPYILTNKYSLFDGENTPMLFFMREPGMVIDYAIGDQWLKNVGNTDKNDEFVVSLFYPDVKTRINDEVGDSFPKFKSQNLGYYLRSCEEAEHSTWTEPSGLRIVERIRVNCASKLASVYTKTVAPTGGDVGLLANYLSNRLMRLPRKSTTGSGGESEKHSSMKIVSVDPTIPGEVRLKYESKLVNADKHVTVQLQLVLDSGHVGFEKWSRADSPYVGPFPVELAAFEVETMTSCDKENKLDCDILANPTEFGGVKMSADKTSVKFNKRDKAVLIRGRALVTVADPMYKFKFFVKAEVNDGE